MDLYVQYLLGSSVSRQFDSFIGGFRAVCNSPAFGVCYSSFFKIIICYSLLLHLLMVLQLFRWEELELLICGSPELNFEELEKSTQYEGYDESHPVIKYAFSILSLFFIYYHHLIIFHCYWM